MKKSVPYGEEHQLALGPKSQEARYGRSWMTLSQRWMNDPGINYPRPDFYVGKTPFTYLTTLEAWEASLPKTSPGPAILRQQAAEKSGLERDSD